MNLVGQKLNSLSRLHKTILVLLNDIFLAFTCWLVFGPPMATIISSNTTINLLSLIYSQIYSFIFPAVLFVSYFYFFGYYRSLIRFFDSRDSIFLCVSGSLIFGFSWAAIYILQFDLIETSLLSVILLQGLLLSAVLICFYQYFKRCSKVLYLSVSKK